jgi:hypothetical protein
VKLGEGGGRQLACVDHGKEVGGERRINQTKNSRSETHIQQ